MLSVNCIEEDEGGPVARALPAGSLADYLFGAFESGVFVCGGDSGGAVTEPVTVEFGD